MGSGIDSIQRLPRSPYSLGEGQMVSAEEEESDTIQTKLLGASQVPLPRGLAAELKALGNRGMVLPDGIRTFMEPRFGVDFGRVRVHAGGRAAKLAQRLNARAFTVGQNVVFGDGQFLPASESGRRLIAHELTHVIQQGYASRSAGWTVPEKQMTSSLVRNNEPGTTNVRRVIWHPNVDTGEEVAPWDEYPTLLGRRLQARTGGGTIINTWRPYDDKTYWCHGFTFGGHEAKGGPYSVGGGFVPDILSDEGWQQTSSCNAREKDLLVFSNGQIPVTHTGIISKVVRKTDNGQVDEERSLLRSKWGWGPLTNESWLTNAVGPGGNGGYGRYHCYSKQSSNQTCRVRGENEGWGSSQPDEHNLPVSGGRSDAD